jgi:hypothetical protein
LSLLAATPSRRRLEIPADATGVPLLPKLRGQFAEFLNRGSLVHLGALAPAHQCRCAVRVARAVRRIPRKRSAIRVEAFLGGTGYHATSAPSSGARNRPWCAPSTLLVCPSPFPKEACQTRVGAGARICLGTHRLRPTGPVHSAGSRCLPRPPIRFRSRECRTIYLAVHRLRWLFSFGTSLGLGPD